jgi:hypothetical protein
MKPESQFVKGATGAQHHQMPEYDPYLVSIVNSCQDDARSRRSENIVVVLDELDSTALRRSTQLPIAR